MCASTPGNAIHVLAKQKQNKTKIHFYVVFVDTQSKKISLRKKYQTINTFVLDPTISLLDNYLKLTSPKLSETMYI